MEKPELVSTAGGNGIFAHVNFTPEIHAPEPLVGTTHCFAFSGDRILIELDSGGSPIPNWDAFEARGLEHSPAHYMGNSDGEHCFAFDLHEDAQPPIDMALKGLRKLYSLDERLFVIAGRAFQIINWDRTHRFCGRCGGATKHHSRDRARECPACHLLSFPRVSPAIIVLVHKGSDFLLAHNRNFTGKRYSILAGFAEPGETLEETVVREVREEVGIEVDEIRYFASQPWPFPHSLMIGFTARYAGGDIEVDGEEIVDAGWYSAGNLPKLPDPVSISRRLINWFLEQHR